jgi:hypothetical protein
MSINKFYLGVRVAADYRKTGNIEVAASGLSFEQLKALKAAFIRIRDENLNGSDVAKVDMLVNPLEDISWNTTGVKNHGVLMLTEKGMILRLPKTLAHDPAKDVYIKIITEWVSESLSISLKNPSRLPEVRAEFTTLGRIDSILSRTGIRGVVIAAPHGSFDQHTGDMVQELSYKTRLAAVITRGFTPTEGGGWRINVNRPTERRYPADDSERGTDRSREIYGRFQDAVVRASGGPLRFYVDVHQSASEEHIDVATVGITREEAEAIRATYNQVRDRVLSRRTNMPRVNLLIEPLDKVKFTALGAKNLGILRLAERGLHIELPAHRILYSAGFRRTYTEILAEWIARLTAENSASAFLGSIKHSPTAAAEVSRSSPAVNFSQ